MKVFVTVFASSLCLLSVLVHAQIPAGSPCSDQANLNPTAKQNTPFNRFDTEFRSAIRHQDARAMSFLVHFPLRVNTDKGSLLIPDAESLGGHFQEIFPLGVRTNILDTNEADYICRYDEGIAYKGGVAWVQDLDGRTGLWSINLPTVSGKTASSKLAYSCETKTNRIVVDEASNGDVRYRSWNKPKPLTASPDVDVAHGKMTFQGTGVCAYPSYTFTVGNVIYEVQGGLGCTDGSEPAKATGHLSVTIGGKQVTDVWCY